MRIITIAFFCALFAFSAAGQEVRTEVITAPAPVSTPEATSTVRGRVFYAETSRPVRRASLMLIPAELGGSPGEYSALTDNEGAFEVRGVKAGAYYPMVNAPGVVSPMAFVDFSQLESGDRRKSEREAFAEAFKDFEKIVVNGVNDIDVMIPARRGGAISGRVSYDDGDAAIGVRVEVMRKVNDSYVGVISNFSAIMGLFGGGGFQTDDRGFFRFAGLPPGEYIVKATENARHSGDDSSRAGFESLILGGSSLLTVFNPDAFDPSAAQPVKVEYGQELTEVNVTIPARYLFKINGRVISRRDKTPVQADVTLQRADEVKTFSILNELGRRAQGARSDTNGDWKFREIPKGKYRIIVSPSNSVEYETVEDEDGEMTRRPKKQPEKSKFAKKIQEIVVEDKDLENLTIELGNGATISGTVIVENRFNEMPNFVTVQFANKEESLSSTATIYNSRPPADRPTSPTTLPSPAPKANQDFKLEGVADGTGTLNVLITDDEYFVKSIMSGSKDLLGTEIEIKEGEAIANVRVVLGKGTGTVKGIVRNEEKEPVAGVRLMFIPLDAKRQNGTFQRLATTDNLGEYSVKLAPGEYAAVFVSDQDMRKKGDDWKVWVEAAMKDAKRVKIESGKTETLELIN